MNRFIAHLLLIIFFGLIVRIAGAATPLGREERNFLRDLYVHGAGENELATYVRERTKSTIIIEYVERLIRDHTDFATQIRALAQSRGVELPQGLSPESRAARAELEKSTGRDLERAYMRRALQEHRTMMVRLEEQDRNARDEGVRDIAHTALARAREHLALAQRWDPSLSPAPPPVVRTIPGGDR